MLSDIAALNFNVIDQIVINAPCKIPPISDAGLHMKEIGMVMVSMTV